MVWFSVFLAIFGLLFLLAEWFFPGIILGILGSIFLLASLFCFYSLFSLNHFFIGISLAILLATVAVLRLGYYWVQKKTALASFEKKEEKEDFSFLIGKQGVVLSDLRPMGKIEVDQKSYSACSDKYTSQGKQVLILEVRDNIIYVKELVG